MTSEVVVMNRLGIALASDSAATVRARGKAKLFQADKLFMLSNVHPVGVMVYNNSSLLGVPWEVILKLFRAKLGEDKFDRLEQYADCLIQYISGSDHLFPPDVQQDFYLQLISTFFSKLAKRVERRVQDLLREGFETGETQLRELQVAVVGDSLNEWREKEDAKCFDRDVGNELVTRSSGELMDLIYKNFPKVKDEVVIALYELARLVVRKADILAESLSGLVIAGFGEKEHFPVMQEYELGEIFLGQLKFRLVDTWRVDNGTTSVIKPFAQSDMVETFLHGISPSLERKFVIEIAKAIIAAPDAIIDGIPGVGKRRKEDYKANIRTVSENAVTELLEKLQNFRLHKHHFPILQSIAFLPKNELAHVASSLVNLSTFQKRMTIGEDETVGGPIDVAVISKGDGFVWIDRKHYFKPEFNEHFFRNRANRSRNGEKNDEQDKGGGHEG